MLHVLVHNVRKYIYIFSRLSLVSLVDVLKLKLYIFKENDRAILAFIWYVFKITFICILDYWVS